MNHVFTISFPFQQQEYTAIVIVKAAQQEPFMQIQLPDASLHHLIPKGVLTYSERHGLNLQISKNRHLTFALISSIVQALEQHSLFKEELL